jgi:adenylyl- and sulfurtransferase ThiI
MGNRHCSFLKKKKYVMVATRRTCLNNTHEKVESIGPKAIIANLNQQLAQTQKNVEDLLAQNALLQLEHLHHRNI